MTDHRITPPPELVEQLRSSPGTWLYQITNAYQAGADQELEACCQALRVRGTRMRCMEANQAIEHLRATRRPQPPSSKEQALAALEVIPKLVGFESERDAIRRALEQL